MMRAEEVDAVIDQIEANPEDLSEFYDRFSESHPMAFAWLTSESAPLTEEEHDYFLFLGMMGGVMHTVNFIVQLGFFSFFITWL